MILQTTRPRAFRIISRAFSSTSVYNRNRIYDTVRNPSELHNLLLLSSSSRTPLITLWTAGWCRSCKIIAPAIHSLVNQTDSFGGNEVGYAEVELDSPDIGDLGTRYMINSIPTLLAFDRQEAQMETKVVKLDQLKDGQFLKEWFEKEAQRRGEGGAGGLFGLFRS